MQINKRGSMIIAVGLIVLALVLTGVIAYNFMYGGKNAIITSHSQKLQPVQPELTKTDEVSDIERDLNSTSIENLDADVLGITSQVE